MKWDTLSFFNSLIINFDMKAWKITGAIIGIILVVVLLRGCVMTSYLIPSSGMENSLFQGERILVNKWSYGLRLPSWRCGIIIAGETVP